MASKKKIFISVTYIKETGGISTSAVNLLNCICDLYDVTLCVPTNYISNKYTLPSTLRIIKGSNYLRDVVCSRRQLSFQDPFQKLLRNTKRILNRYLFKEKGIERALDSIKITEEFDVAIAFSDFAYNVQEKLCYDYYIIANKVIAKKKVAWIHANPEILGWNAELIKKRLAGFDFIINVSEDCKKIFDRIYPMAVAKSKVVLNTYNIADITSKGLNAEERVYDDNEKLQFVTVARVEFNQKRHDRIVEVCRRLISEGYSNFEWTIVGDGGALKILQDRVSEHGLQNSLHFIGHRDNPYPYMSQADAFILPSEYEGFGMTIKEAQILGCPTFITNFGAAPEVVKNLNNGEICDNSTEGLYIMTKGILDNPAKLDMYRRYLSGNPVTNDEALRQFNAICNS